MLRPLLLLLLGPLLREAVGVEAEETGGLGVRVVHHRRVHATLIGRRGVGRSRSTTTAKHAEGVAGLLLLLLLLGRTLGSLLLLLLLLLLQWLAGELLAKECEGLVP